MALQKACLLHIMKDKDMMKHVIMNMENEDREYMHEMISSKTSKCNSPKCKYVVGCCGFGKIIHNYECHSRNFKGLCKKCQIPLCEYCKDDTYNVICKRCVVELLHDRKHVCDECFLKNDKLIKFCYGCDDQLIAKLICNHNNHDEDYTDPANRYYMCKECFEYCSTSSSSSYDDFTSS